ncbi:hypothetical protein [Glycomyces sp. YM15]|uniref:hypothetical protein n=1 Tax=Glycomyces sp. YM15 TaxID=2800446 RepID=UPI00196381D1|nr:hypothetical protein [Glycomyces sp. YM15]
MSLPASPPYEMPGKTRAAVIILWIGAALGAVLGLIAMRALGSVSGPDTAIVTLLFALVLGGALLNAVCAIAIQKRQNWARITAIVLCAIGVAGQAVNLLTGDASAVIGLGLNIVIIVLLVSWESKQWCGAA